VSRSRRGSSGKCCRERRREESQTLLEQAPDQVGAASGVIKYFPVSRVRLSRGPGAD
jgi:hypothetical protein